MKLQPDSDESPFPAVIIDSVFAESPQPSEQAAIFEGIDPNQVQAQVQWFELSCAHSAESTTFISGVQPVTGSIPRDWQKFWKGSSRIVNVVAGPRAVLLEGQALTDQEISPADFTLLEGTLATRWNDLGKPIGATPSRIGPAPLASEESSDKNKPKPVKIPKAAF